jgi:hypothetical protein
VFAVHLGDDRVSGGTRWLSMDKMALMITVAVDNGTHVIKTSCLLQLVPSEQVMLLA